MAADDMDAEARPDRARAARLVRVAFAVLCVCVAIAAAAWLAFGSGSSDDQPPLIAADEGPERSLPDPDKPNGAEIPHTDQSVYDIVSREDARKGGDAMAPAPETPLPAPDDADAPATANAEPEGPVQLLPPDPAPDVIDPPEKTLAERAVAEAAEAADAAKAEMEAAQKTVDDLMAKAEPLTVETADPPSPAAPEMAKPETPEPAPATEMAKPEMAKPEPAAPLPSARSVPPAEPEPRRAEPAPAPALASLPPDSVYRIQVGAVRNRSDAQREWRRLRQRNSDILGSLQMFVQEVNIRGKGTFHRIQAGPLPDKALAELACGNLRARKVPCFVVAK